jgi:phenylalanyl-tRNA synthetase beta chain
MQLSMKWLADYTDVSDISIKDYCDRMTMTGSKVEGYEEIAENISGVICGKIVKIDRHPNAERLVICQVEAGDKTLQIITAATNVFEGAIVPVAIDGAHLNGDIKIKKGKLRGEVSEGMFCSIEELGLTLNEGDVLLVADGVSCSAPAGVGSQKARLELAEQVGRTLYLHLNRAVR